MTTRKSRTGKKTGMGTEFDRQVNVLVEKGYPALARMSEKKFRAGVEPLRVRAESLVATARDREDGRLPFVIVVHHEWITAAAMLKKVERGGKAGVMGMKPCTPDEFTTIDRVDIPAGRAYLLVGIDRGEATLNIRPEDAMKTIRKARRSPLTIDEGLAIVTQFPDFLRKNHCFSLLASRRGDQRVPALWIDGNKAPKLGWCWDRNPHTWLGSASAKKRLGAEE